MQQQFYNIAIYEEAILLTDFTRQDAPTFVVDQEDLMQLFRFNLQVTLKPFDGLVWMKKDLEGKTSYLVTLPRQRRKLIYKADRFQHVSMEIPNVLLLLRIANGKTDIRNLWAYPGKLKSTTQLYELALPNIGGSSICLGSASVTTTKNVIKDAETLLFETPFNHHRQLVGKNQIPFLEYVKQHKGKMPFHTLRPLETAKRILEEK